MGGHENLYEHIMMRRSDANVAFVAEVPELPGCMADGQSYHEALTNAELVFYDVAFEMNSLHTMSDYFCFRLPDIRFRSVW
jgi:hypothetical protein